MASSTAGPSSIQGAPPGGWPPDPVAPVGYMSRKALPIKRNDAEPLTREDVQYDLLYHIFSDARTVFTSPLGKLPGEPPAKVHFCDLYVNALYKSSKCSKVLKDKMVETPMFAVELAKISLLTNVGRINTTMAFFPEMKTALRTYHPVPSLQKTDGNAQDAPRIKNCLKAALLPAEIKGDPPSTPEQILEKLRAGIRPPTSVVNLIFVLANHAAPLAGIHFDEPVNFLDLFLPINLSSASRARAFLWLMFHYLEGPNLPNPFDDEYSRKNPGKVPWLHRMTEAEMRRENVDTPEEIHFGSVMSAQRDSFLQRLMSSIDAEKKAKPMATVNPTKEVNYHRLRQRHMPGGEREKPFLHYVPPSRDQQGQAELDRKRASEYPSRPARPRRDNSNGSAASGDQRSLLEHAWQVVSTTDPLQDSDEELPDADGTHVRRDYIQRLSVINRLRGRSPTPPPEPQSPPPIDTRKRKPKGFWRRVESWDN